MPLDRDTVLRLAREAANSGDGSELSGDAIERFAQLVFLEAAGGAAPVYDGVTTHPEFGRTPGLIPSTERQTKEPK